MLTQIILEFDTPKLDTLPVSLLVQIIRMNDSMIRDFVEKYFNQALKSYFDYQERLQTQIRQMHETHPVFPSVGEWTKAMLGPFASVMTGGAPARPPEPEPLQEMIRDLQRQVAELKAKQVPRQRRPKPPKK